MIKNRSHYLFMFLLLYSSAAFASDANFNNTSQLPLTPNAAGNVGIGSANPGQLLDVQGTVRALNFTGNGSGLTNLNGINYWLNDTGNVGINTMYNIGIGTISQVNSLNILGNIGIGTFSYDPYMKTAAPSGGMIIAGNVGIGTWNPQYYFQIGPGAASIFYIPTLAGSAIDTTANQVLFNQTLSPFILNNTANPGESLSLSGGNGADAALVFYSTSIENGNSVSGTTDYIDFNVGGNKNTDAMRVIDSGNVGIGSITPGQKLDVQGTVRMLGFNIANNAGAGKVLTSDASGNGTWGTAGAGSNYWLNDTGNIGISTAYAVGIGTISQTNKLNILGNIGIGTFSYDPYMKTAAPSGGMIISGNVGIGTWVPTAALQIGANSLSGNGPPPQLFLGTFSSGAGYPQLVGNWNNSTDWGIGQATPSATDNAILLGVTAAPNFAPFSWGSTGLNVLVSGNIGIGTITTTGMNTNLYVPTNVGIGTKTPADTLDVVGNPSSGDMAILQNTSASGQADIGFRDNTGVAKLWFGYSNSSNAAPYTSISFMEFDSPAFEITNNNGAGLSEYFTSTGNVGIGTFGPLSKLNVNGGVGIGTTLTNSAYISGNSAPSGGLIVQGNVGIGTFNPFGGGLIVLPANTGNVGIGSLVPGQALDVNGTVRMTGFNIANNAGAGKVLTSDASGNGTWGPAGAGLNYWLLNGGAGNVGINTSYAVGIGTSFVGGTGEAALSVMKGNVGIGTWVPINALDIIGSEAIGSGYAGVKVASPAGSLILTGNLGIGTFNPGHILTVNGTSVFESSVYLGTDNNDAGSWSTATVGGTSTPETNLTSVNWLALSGGNSADQMLISSQGNVGIGTFQFSNKLNIEGGVGIGTFGANNFVNNQVAGGSLAVQNNVGIGTSFVGGTGEAALSIMNGNVGIGTWVPNSTLQVAGNVGIGTSALASTPSYTLNVNNTVVFNSEYNNGNSGAALTINWNKGNKQRVTLNNNNCTLTFTAPSGSAMLLIKLIQDGTGGRGVTWPGTVEWTSGTAPTLTTAANSIDIVTCYYDGTSYFCNAAFNFQP